MAIATNRGPDIYLFKMERTSEGISWVREHVLSEEHNTLVTSVDWAVSRNWYEL